MWARNKLSVKERFEDVFEFEGTAIEQSLETEPPSCVYDAAIVMAKFIEKNCDVNGKTLVELGAGCGFTACHLAHQRPEVTKIVATDMETVLPLIQKNIENNQKGGKVVAMPLFWGNQEHLEAVKE